MLAIHKIFWHEFTSRTKPVRQNEPEATMEDFEQVKSYVKAYEWGGPTTTLMMHHLKELSKLIKAGDTVCDLACGPGSLLLELARIYPDTKFIGIDLSPVMLGYLKNEAKRLQLKNVSVLCEDISTLPSFIGKKVDLVISTSALHHLPDETTLRNVFKRLNTLVKNDGGFYFFDFGLLKSQKSRDICVAETAKLAPPITVQDYHVSLQAAFPIATVFQMAKEECPRPFKASSSSFFDFFYFIQTPPRAVASDGAKAHIKAHRKYMTLSMKIELVMLSFLRDHREFAREISPEENTNLPIQEVSQATEKSFLTNGILGAKTISVSIAIVASFVASFFIFSSSSDNASSQPFASQQQATLTAPQVEKSSWDFSKDDGSDLVTIQKAFIHDNAKGIIYDVAGNPAWKRKKATVIKFPKKFTKPIKLVIEQCIMLSSRASEDALGEFLNSLEYVPCSDQENTDERRATLYNLPQRVVLSKSKDKTIADTPRLSQTIYIFEDLSIAKMHDNKIRKIHRYNLGSEPHYVGLLLQNYSVGKISIHDIEDEEAQSIRNEAFNLLAIKFPKIIDDR